MHLCALQRLLASGQNTQETVWQCTHGVKVFPKNIQLNLLPVGGIQVPFPQLCQALRVR